MTIDELELIIPFKDLTDNGLTLEQWFILYCVYTNQKDIIERYTERCNKLDIRNFSDLKDMGYIGLSVNQAIKFSDVKLTTKTQELFSKSQIAENNIKFEDCFKELRETYPSKVPSDNGTSRVLQGDIKRCKKLYHRIIISKGTIVNVDLHNKILNAIRKQYLEYDRGRKLPYFQNLATYLHQENYEPYLEEDNIVKKEINFNDDI